MQLKDRLPHPLLKCCCISIFRLLSLSHLHYLSSVSIQSHAPLYKTYKTVFNLDISLPSPALVTWMAVEDGVIPAFIASLVPHLLLLRRISSKMKIRKDFEKTSLQGIKPNSKMLFLLFCPPRITQILIFQLHKWQNLSKYNQTSFSPCVSSLSLRLLLISNKSKRAAFKPMRHKADFLWLGINTHLLIFKGSGLYLYTVCNV